MIKAVEWYDKMAGKNR